jgi:hypothetical protein
MVRFEQRRKLRAAAIAPACVGHYPAGPESREAAARNVDLPEGPTQSVISSSLPLHLRQQQGRHCIVARLKRRDSAHGERGDGLEQCAQLLDAAGAEASERSVGQIGDLAEPGFGLGVEAL